MAYYFDNGALVKNVIGMFLFLTFRYNLIQFMGGHTTQNTRHILEFLPYIEARRVNSCYLHMLF